MSDVCDFISTEASMIADDMHSDIVYEAIERHSNCHCPNCNYPQKVREFAQIHNEYVQWRRMLSFAERQVRLGWKHNRLQLMLPVRILIICKQMSETEESEIILQEMHIREEVNRLKAKFADVRPCGSCKLKYNPTRRTRNDLYPEPNKPQKRQLLEV